MARVLDQLGTRSEAGKHRVRLRVTLADGSVQEGELDGVSPTELFLIATSDERRHEIAAADIAAVRVAAPRRGREWLLALGAIGLSVPALYGVASVLGYSLQHEAQQAFSVVYLAGAGVMALLLRTRLREWLTRWDLWFAAGDD